MNPTDEPKPRNPPKPWSCYSPPLSSTRQLMVPSARSNRDFFNVIDARRSAVGGPIHFDRVADLLWYAVGSKGQAPSGRAGIPIEWRFSPSSGGLHPIHVVCVPETVADDILLYDAIAHEVGVLDLDADEVVRENSEEVFAVVGTRAGWTLRFIVDFDKADAAYENAWSLILRDAGCLIATICLCAEWLDMAACPLGFLGQDLCGRIGFPHGRFTGGGGVQLSSK